MLYNFNIEEIPLDGVTHLDLSWKNIDDNQAIVIAKIIETNTTIIDLNLAHNNITDVGLEHIANAVRNNMFLRNLDLSGNAFTATGEKIIETILSDLEINNNILALSNIAYKGMITYLEKIPQDVKNTDQYKIFEQYKHNTSLSLPDLRGNSSIKTDLIISYLQHETITNLKIDHGANWNTTQFEEFLNALSQVETLRSFSIGWFRINDTMADHLGKFLAKTSTLLSITLDHCKIGDVEVREITKELTAGKSSLVSLNLPDNEITDDAVGDLIVMIKENKNIAHLGLESNKITDRGADYFIHLIKEKGPLVSLNLNQNKISSEKVNNFIPCIKYSNLIACDIIFSSTENQYLTDASKTIDTNHKKVEKIIDYIQKYDVTTMNINDVKSKVKGYESAIKAICVEKYSYENENYQQEENVFSILECIGSEANHSSNAD
jgi:hypothetical protein